VWRAQQSDLCRGTRSRSRAAARLPTCFNAWRLCAACARIIGAALYDDATWCGGSSSTDTHVDPVMLEGSRFRCKASRRFHVVTEGMPPSVRHQATSCCRGGAHDSRRRWGMRDEKNGNAPGTALRHGEWRCERGLLLGIGIVASPAIDMGANIPRSFFGPGDELGHIRPAIARESGIGRRRVRVQRSGSRGTLEPRRSASPSAGFGGRNEGWALHDSGRSGLEQACRMVRCTTRSMTSRTADGVGIELPLRKYHAYPKPHRERVRSRMDFRSATVRVSNVAQ